MIPHIIERGAPNTCLRMRETWGGRQLFLAVCLGRPSSRQPTDVRVNLPHQPPPPLPPPPPSPPPPPPPPSDPQPPKLCRSASKARRGRATSLLPAVAPRRPPSCVYPPSEVYSSTVDAQPPMSPPSSPHRAPPPTPTSPPSLHPSFSAPLPIAGAGIPTAHGDRGTNSATRRPGSRPARRLVRQLAACRWPRHQRPPLWRLAPCLVEPTTLPPFSTDFSSKFQISKCQTFPACVSGKNDLGPNPVNVSPP